MKYNLKSQIDKERFKKRCNELYEQGEFVELKNLKKRSLRQNSYLHLILVYFACENGYDMEHTKQYIFKLECNKETFLIEKVNRITGEQYQTVRSTADLSKEELTTCINRFLNFSLTRYKLRLPEPSDLVWLQEIEILEQQNKEFL